MATGLYSIPYWSSGMPLDKTGGAHEGQVGGRAGIVPGTKDVRVLPVRHCGVRVAEVDHVDEVLAELGQFLGGIEAERRQDLLEELIRLGDPFLPGRLVGIVRDRERVVEVDLAVAVRQTRGVAVDRRPVAVPGDSGGVNGGPVRNMVARGVLLTRGTPERPFRPERLYRPALVVERVPLARPWSNSPAWARGTGCCRSSRRGVVVGPGEAVGLPGIGREQPAAAHAVDGVDEADRRQVGQPAVERVGVHVLIAIEPLQVSHAERLVHLGCAGTYRFISAASFRPAVGTSELTNWLNVGTLAGPPGTAIQLPLTSFVWLPVLSRSAGSRGVMELGGRAGYVGITEGLIAVSPVVGEVRYRGGAHGVGITGEDVGEAGGRHRHAGRPEVSPECDPAERVGADVRSGGPVHQVPVPAMSIGVTKRRMRSAGSAVSPAAS